MAKVTANKLIQSVFLLSNFLIHYSVDGKKCFTCSSLYDNRCRDPFTSVSEFIVNCPRGSECRKLIIGNEVRRNCSSDGAQPQESSTEKLAEVCFQQLLKITDTIPFVGTKTETRLVTVCNCERALCNLSTNLISPPFYCHTCLVFILIFIIYY